MSTDTNESAHDDDTAEARAAFDRAWPPGARPAFRTCQAGALPGWLARGAPVLTPRQLDSETWVVDACPWCGGQHRHGAGPGHRIAPCGGDNPGYVLGEAA
jgi:hypothetical protein